MIRLRTTPRVQNIYWDPSVGVPNLIPINIFSTADSFDFVNYELDFQGSTPWLAGPSYLEVYFGTADLELTVGNLSSLAPGVYTCIINFSTFGESGEGDASATVYLTVGGAPIDPEDPEDPDDPTDPEDPSSDPVFKRNYLMEHENLQGDMIQLEILKRNYEGESTNIQGRVKYEYQSKKDLFDTIIASSLQIEIEASSNLKMLDLYSEVENTFKVVLRKNSEVLFVGWLKPDGVYESLVEDLWVLDIDAFDGLSVLKNLSYVKPDGTFFTTKMSVLNVIKNCLDRTGLNLPINISIPIFYEGFQGNTILEETIVSNERYYQDSSNKDIMDCEAVLKSLLSVFNATVIQQNGEWYIYRSIDVKPGMNFKKYINGTYLSSFDTDPSQIIGSHINDAQIMYCGANQKKTIAPSVQAHRVYYKFGNATNLLQNGALEAGVGFTMPGWTLYGENANNPVRIQQSRYGLELVPSTYSVYDDYLIALNQTMNLAKGNSVAINVNMDFPTGRIVSGFNDFDHSIRFYVSTDNYYLHGSEWVAKGSNPNHPLDKPTGNIIFSKNGGGLIWETVTPGTMESSNIYFKIHAYVNTRKAAFKLNSIDIVPSNTNVKGVYYTGQRTTRVSSVTKENETVYNGDSQSDLFVGTMLTDDLTGTTLWYREGFDESKEILQIKVEDALRISPRPMQVFEGDIYGYFPYLSILNLSLLEGRFLPISYSYDTYTGINKISAKEFETTPLEPNQLLGGGVKIDPDFGNETKVTIIS